MYMQTPRRCNITRNARHACVLTHSQSVIIIFVSVGRVSYTMHLELLETRPSRRAVLKCHGSLSLSLYRTRACTLSSAIHRRSFLFSRRSRRIFPYSRSTRERARALFHSRMTRRDSLSTPYKFLRPSSYRRFHASRARPAAAACRVKSWRERGTARRFADDI